MSFEKPGLMMSNSLITTQSEFDTLCDDLAGSSHVGFDTEFVSESYYRPKLCLMQFATDQRVAAVDPLAVPDVSRWWKIMAGAADSASANPTVIVHGGREEIRFCLNHTGCSPAKLVDVQVAEGLLSHGYPLGYENLVQRVLGHRLAGGQTRTDWQRRPLTGHQLDYALEDVKHLIPIWTAQQANLQKNQQGEWAFSEFERLIGEVLRERDKDCWRRLPHVGKLNCRELGILRALHAWREVYAARINRPARVACRDDLLIEVARRKPKNASELSLLRGMAPLQRSSEEILAAVRTGLELPEADLPDESDSVSSHPRDDILVRILSLALADRCSGLGVSQTMIGNSSDLHEIVRWHVHQRGKGPTPRLLQGWRATICGDYLTDVLEGRVLLAVGDPRADQPLRFLRSDGNGKS